MEVVQELVQNDVGEVVRESVPNDLADVLPGLVPNDVMEVVQEMIDVVEGVRQLVRNNVARVSWCRTMWFES